MNCKVLIINQQLGRIDFKKIKETGYSIVSIKAGEGSGIITPFFETNNANAKKENLKVSFYYFVTARSASQAKHQAYQFARITSLKPYHCPLMADFSDLSHLTKHEIEKIETAFLDVIKDLTGTASLSVQPNGENNMTYTTLKDLTFPFYSYNLTPALLFSTSHIHQTPPDDCYPFLETTIRYRVKKGDTLTKIAALYHTTVNELVKVNHIEDKNLIYINQILKVPIDDERLDFF